ncbi:MAG: ComEC/Rec2 family competence protein [Prevotella sp.]|nr:ComEC/Rec2 family competence protein [Prevotella sp.]
MSRRPFVEAPLLKLCLFLTGGILIGYYAPASEGICLSLAGVLLIAAIGLRRFPTAQSLLLGLCLAAVGATLTIHQRQALHVQWQQGYAIRRAVVASEPAPRKKTLVMDLLTENGAHKIRCHIITDERSRKLHVGDGIEFCSEMATPTLHRLYYESHGYAGSTIVWARQWRTCQVSLQQLSHVERSRLRSLQLRRRLLNRYRDSGLDEAPFSVVAAMTLGDKSALPAEQQDIFAATGTSHVLAMSGLHLGIIYSLLSLLVIGRRLRSIMLGTTVVAIWGFAFLVGLSPSIVRAALMLSVYAILSIGHRDRMSVNTLAFAAIALLIANPLTLFDVGFQLSFVAVLSILLFFPIINEWVSPVCQQRHPLLRWVWQLTAVSLAAQLGVAPLLAFYFHRLATYFLLANFVVIPAATLILYGALLMMLIPQLATPLMWVVRQMTAALEAISHLPAATIGPLYPSLTQTLLTYVAIGCTYILLTHIRRISRK